LFDFRIERGERLPCEGRTKERRAVRAVVRDGGRILMIHSLKAGDYKFPGGGVEAGESESQALARELEEEAGRVCAGEPLLIGRVVERSRAMDADYDLFVMLSEYYTVAVTDERLPQRLERYEATLGFTPVWIEPALAREANARLLAAEGVFVPRWTRRETLVLEKLLELEP